MSSDRSPARSFRDLRVWQKAHQFVLAVYRYSESFPEREKYGLAHQLRRAAVSIPANIAEGFGKRSQAEKGRFLNIAEGSVEECRFYFPMGYQGRSPCLVSKGHFNHFVWCCGSSVSIGKALVRPMEGLRRCPDRLSFVLCVLYDDAHAVTAIIIREVTHDPHTWMIHLDDGRNAFRRSEPEHRLFCRRGHYVAVQHDDF